MVPRQNGSVNAAPVSSTARRPRLLPRKPPPGAPYFVEYGEDDDDDFDSGGKNCRLPHGNVQNEAGEDEIGKRIDDALARRRLPPTFPSRGIWLPSSVLRVSQTAAQDRVLGDLYYWTSGSPVNNKPRAKIYHDGRYWVWRVLPRYAENLGLTLGQIRRAIIDLVSKGFVLKQRGQWGRTLLAFHVRNVVKAAEAIRESAQSPICALDPPPPLKAGHRCGVFVPPWALFLSKTPAEQRFLGQLNYWMGASKSTGRARAKWDTIDRHCWETKSYSQWAAEIKVTPDAVERAVRSLRAMGIVRVKYVRAGHAAKFRLDYRAIEELIKTRASV